MWNFQRQEAKQHLFKVEWIYHALQWNGTCLRALNLMLMLNENGGGLTVLITNKSKHHVFETKLSQSCKSRCIHEEHPADHWCQYR